MQEPMEIPRCFLASAYKKTTECDINVGYTVYLIFVQTYVFISVLGKELELWTVAASSRLSEKFRLEPAKIRC